MEIAPRGLMPIITCYFLMFKLVIGNSGIIRKAKKIIEKNKGLTRMFNVLAYLISIEKTRYLVSLVVPRKVRFVDKYFFTTKFYLFIFLLIYNQMLLILCD